MSLADPASPWCFSADGRVSQAHGRINFTAVTFLPGVFSLQQEPQPLAVGKFRDCTLSACSPRPCPARILRCFFSLASGFSRLRCSANQTDCCRTPPPADHGFDELAESPQRPSPFSLIACFDGTSALSLRRDLIFLSSRPLSVASGSCSSLLSPPGWHRPLPRLSAFFFHVRGFLSLLLNGQKCSPTPFTPVSRASCSFCS